MNEIQESLQLTVKKLTSFSPSDAGILLACGIDVEPGAVRLVNTLKFFSLDKHLHRLYTTGVSGNAKDRRVFRRKMRREGWVYLPPANAFRRDILDGAPFHRFVDRPFTEEEWLALEEADLHERKSR